MRPMVVGSASSKPITSLHAFYCPEPSETITPSGGAGNCTSLMYGLGDNGDQANFRGGCNDYLSGPHLR